jgi:phage head maturation protease
MPSEIECRANQSAVECRSGEQRRIGGLAAAFGSPSQLLPGGFVEIVDPQAFSASRESGFGGVIATYEHRDLTRQREGQHVVARHHSARTRLHR